MKNGRYRYLVLFDIDGTLISAGRSGYSALEQATREILGAPLGLSGIRLDGNTDSLAIRQICARDDRPLPDEACLSQFKQRYTEILRRQIVGKGHVKPGVEDLLEKLRRQNDVCLGLVTGNIREGAEIKLRHFGLWEYFVLGAFGCEDPERSRLIGFAMDRAARLAGEVFLPANVTMVGDTIYDVTACHPWGINSLAVGTGSWNLEDLRQARAKWVLPDLAETEWVMKLLTNSTASVL